jgi:NAD(P)-dependent dehydrogenase (short-subunit alcohol dehydrogenase family)
MLIDQRTFINDALQSSAVTGGGSGIGFAFAKACHGKGARVLIGDLKLTDEADQYVSKDKDSTLLFQKCDVSSWDDLHDLISTSVKKFSAVPDVYAPIVGVLFPQHG